ELPVGTNLQHLPRAAAREPYPISDLQPAVPVRPLRPLRLLRPLQRAPLLPNPLFHHPARLARCRIVRGAPGGAQGVLDALAGFEQVGACLLAAGALRVPLAPLEVGLASRLRLLLDREPRAEGIELDRALAERGLRGRQLALALLDRPE